MSRAIATFLYVGYLRPAPGSWGSAAAVLVALPVLAAGPWVLAGLAALAFAAGLWATQREAGPEDHDPSRIVIDEVAGQWIALLPLAWLSRDPSLSQPMVFAGAALAFALFRLFDIWKPWPVRWADARADALGVMLDDVIAGLMAALIWAMIAGIALIHLFLSGWTQ